MGRTHLGLAVLMIGLAVVLTGCGWLGIFAGDEEPPVSPAGGDPTPPPDGALAVTWTGGSISDGGTVDLGTTSSSVIVDFTIENTGAGNLTLPVDAVSLSGDAEISVQSQPSSGAIAPGGTAPFQLLMTDQNGFDATDTEPAAVVQVYSDDPDSPFNYNVAGVTGEPNIEVWEYDWLNAHAYVRMGSINNSANIWADFEQSPLPDRVWPWAFEIRNTGDAPLVISSVDITDTQPTDPVTLSTEPYGPIVAPGTTEELLFRLQSTVNAVDHANAFTVKVIANDPDEGEFTFSVNGSIC